MTPRTDDLPRGGDSSSGRRAAHDRILAAARECIVRTGGPTPSIREVAEQAGVHRSTIYEYFAGRDDVLVAVFAREAHEVFMSVSHHFDRTEFLTALTHAIADGVTLAHESPVLHRLVSPAGAGRTASATMASQAWDAAIQSTLANLMAEAVERGEVRDDVPVEELIRWVVRVAISVTASPPPQPRWTLEQFLIPALRAPGHRADAAQAP